MKSLIEYLDEAKEITGSDYATAARMGVTRGAISNYRHGRSRPDDYVTFKLAELLKIDERSLFIALNAEVEKDMEKRRFWEKLGGVAASIIMAFFLCVTLIVTPKPAEAAPAHGSEVKSLYIM